jgi:hypothetical protein
MTVVAWRRHGGDRPRSDAAPRAPEAAEPELLRLQREAGNAAVARLLARQALEMRKPDLTVHDPGSQEAAFAAVEAWFDALAEGVRGSEAGTPIQSVAELVHMASELTFTADDGKQARVGDHVKPSALERWMRERAKRLGIQLLEHRDASDPRGVAAEAAAIFGNLGRVPTDVSFGGGTDHITISLTGTVSVEAKAGDVKFEGEASSEGATAKASVKGSVGELEAHGSTEGVGTSLKTPGGTKVGVDLGKGVEAELDAGDLLKITGSIQPAGDGKVSWSAQITIGTLGNVVTADDVAKVMKGAQDTFSRSGAALLHDPSVDALAENGHPLKQAVTDVVEKAKKSAAQAKPGWSVGVGVKGDKSGGVSGTVTLTWVF